MGTKALWLNEIWDVLHIMDPSGVTRHVDRQEILKVKKNQKTPDDLYFTLYFSKLLNPVMCFKAHLETSTGLSPQKPICSRALLLEVLCSDQQHGVTCVLPGDAESQVMAPAH